MRRWIKRFFIFWILILSSFAAYDGGRHFYILYLLKEQHALSFDVASLGLDLEGFYTKIEGVSYYNRDLNKTVHIQYSECRADLRRWKKYTIFFENLAADVFSSDNGSLSFSYAKNKILLHSLILNKNKFVSSFGIFMLPVLIAEGRIDDRLILSWNCLHLTKDGDDYGTFSGFLTINDFFFKTRHGLIKVKIGAFQKFLDSLLHSQDIPSWQKGLIRSVFGSSVSLSLELQNNALFLGPLKLVDLQ